MKAHDMNGQEFDITREEVERLAGELAARSGKETNDAFLARAMNNIKAVTGVMPQTEDELKELLYQHTTGTSMKEIELLYEAMEVITGWHSKKTKSM